MTKDKFQEIKKDLEKIISNSYEPNDLTHGRITLKLVKKLKPKADYTLQIAALAHDIDRGLPNRKRRVDYPGDYEAFKKAHSISGARAVVKILRKHKVNNKIIAKVKKLIENHEFGGDKETNILMDADSLAFFYFDLENKYLVNHTPRQAFDKIIWMYNRITLPQRKQIAKQMKYENRIVNNIFNKAMKKLEQAQEKEYKKIEQTLIKAVSRAGDELLQRFQATRYGRGKKKSKHETITPSDRAANRIILKEIKRTFPEHSIISEEGDIPECRLQDKRSADIQSEFTWCIDPLDGTTNFSIGNPLFAVSIAIFENKKLFMSTVYAPYLKEFYFAQTGKGASFIKGYKAQECLKGFKRAIRIKVSQEKRLLHSICTYCSGYDEKVYPKMEKIETKLRKQFQEARLLGTASLELAWVAAGRTESMIVPAANLWDVAAGILLVHEAGGKVTDFKGREWEMGSKGMVATSGKIHRKVLNIVNK